MYAAIMINKKKPDRDRLERSTDDSFDRGGVRYSVHGGLSATPFSGPQHSSLSWKVKLNGCLGWPPAWKIKSTVLMFWSLTRTQTMTVSDGQVPGLLDDYNLHDHPVLLQKHRHCWFSGK